MTGAASLVPRQKHIALIAHDECKQDLLDWAQYNKQALAQHVLFGAGTTGALLQQELGLSVTTFMSGPLGGDQQIGARIAEGLIDLLIFFWDPLESHPHDPDVRALLRLAVLQNIPVAMNRASADFMFTSPLIASDYTSKQYDYGERLHRRRVIERFTGTTPK